MDELRSPAHVSRKLAVSQSTLRRWRSVGEGPAFVRVGRQVRYRDEDVNTWLQRHHQPAGVVA